MSNPTKPDLPSVVVIVLNWNGKNDTIDCLRSLASLEYSNAETVVVDNASSDDSVWAILAEFPDLTILQTGANCGYAGGNNFGIKYAIEKRFDYVLLLNNDTIVSPELISKFIQAQRSLPERTILGARIYFHHDPSRLWFAGGHWNENIAEFEHIGIGRLDQEVVSTGEVVDYITGCALFAPTSAFVETGLLDEDLFLTYEETDWCYRAQRIGYKCHVVPNARLWHKVSASFGGAQSPLAEYFMYRNRLVWSDRHASDSARRLVKKQARDFLVDTFFPIKRCFQLDSIGPRSIYWGIRNTFAKILSNIDDPFTQARLYALRDYFFRRLGDCPEGVRRLRSTGVHGA